MLRESVRDTVVCAKEFHSYLESFRVLLVTLEELPDEFCLTERTL